MASVGQITVGIRILSPEETERLISENKELHVRVLALESELRIQKERIARAQDALGPWGDGPQIVPVPELAETTDCAECYALRRDYPSSRFPEAHGFCVPCCRREGPCSKKRAA